MCNIVKGKYYKLVNKYSDVGQETWFFKVKKFTNGIIYIEDWAINNNQFYSRNSEDEFHDHQNRLDYTIYEVELSSFVDLLPNNLPDKINYLRKERIKLLLNV